MTHRAANGPRETSLFVCSVKRHSDVNRFEIVYDEHEGEDMMTYNQDLMNKDQWLRRKNDQDPVALLDIWTVTE